MENIYLFTGLIFYFFMFRGMHFSILFNSFQRLTNWCKTYAQDGLVYKKDSHNAVRCIATSGTNHMEVQYLFSTKRQGETFSCEELRKQGNSGFLSFF